MKSLFTFKLAALAALTLASVACAQAVNDSPLTVTADYLLNALVQIATKEDLADDKRIGELLKIDFQMVRQEPRVTTSGEIALDSIALEPKNTRHLHPNSYFYYGVRSAPMRASTLALTFNSLEICIKVTDVYSVFIKHGSLNPLPRPGQVPPPPGTFYPPVKQDQPIHGYAFEGKKTSGSLIFANTNCLTGIQLSQPKANK